MNNKKMITIGKITKNQGNKGEVRVLPLTDIPERFEYLETVSLIKGDKILEKEIESLRFHKNFVVIKFIGINDIDTALELRNFEIIISKEMVLPLDDYQYYIEDILGYKVYTNDGQFIGNIAEVISTGGTDVFVIKGEDKDYMIPAALEIIVEFNEDEGQMVINPIPGLLEL